MLKYILAVALLIAGNAWGYKLPWFYTPNETTIHITNNSDGTYNFYLNESPTVKIYQSKPTDLDGFMEIRCAITTNIAGASFSYVNYQKFPPETVFLNPKNKELSPIYPIDDCMSPNHYAVMAEADNEKHMQAVIIQPIFKSQPKVWIVMKRNFNTLFPAITYDPGTTSKFLSNGNLYLVVQIKTISTSKGMRAAPVKAETIPIDYSVFQNPGNKPTCYAIPEDHKMRTCTPEEEKIRSPSLKGFLGES